MLRLIVVLLIIAGVAGYFTRPDEAKMRTAADAILSNPQNVSQGVESLGATIAGDRAYDNYYVGAKYSVSVNSKPVVTCWGGWTVVQCNREQSSDASKGG